MSVMLLIWPSAGHHPGQPIGAPAPALLTTTPTYAPMCPSPVPSGSDTPRCAPTRSGLPGHTLCHHNLCGHASPFWHAPNPVSTCYRCPNTCRGPFGTPQSLCAHRSFPTCIHAPPRPLRACPTLSACIRPLSSDASSSVQNPTPNREQLYHTTPHRTDQCSAGSRQYNLFAVQVTVVFCEGVRTAVHRFRTDLPIGCWDSWEMTFLQEY